MVLYYGLLALETANNTVAATTSACQRESISKKSKPSEQMSSSSNSWIYTADLRKRFEERYGDYRYIFVPVYIDGKPSRYNSNSTAIIPQKFDNENSWIYSRPFYDHLFNSTSKMSSSTCYVTNQAFMRDELPRKKTSKKNFFQRSSSVKNKSTTSLSPTFYLTKHRTNDVVEEDDDENPENENHLIPLIKHNSVISSHATTESSNDNPILVNTTINNELKNTKSNTKHVTTHNNTLTRLRSFFFKSSSTLVGTQE